MEYIRTGEKSQKQLRIIHSIVIFHSQKNHIATKTVWPQKKGAQFDGALIVSLSFELANRLRPSESVGATPNMFTGRSYRKAQRAVCVFRHGPYGPLSINSLRFLRDLLCASFVFLPRGAFISIFYETSRAGFP